MISITIPFCNKLDDRYKQVMSCSQTSQKEKTFPALAINAGCSSGD